MPDTTQEQQIKESTGQAGEAPKVTPDEYIGQRHEQKREKRGGVQVRIDKLTKEKSELAARLAAVEQKQAVPIVVNTPAPVAAPVADKPDPRPKREDFPDEGEFTTKIAEWVVRQQNKIVATAPAAATPATPEVKEATFDPANPTHAQLKTEFDGFMTVGQEFIKGHADFNDRLNAAAAKGLTLDNMAQRAIIKLKSPQVLYYLADPANETQARALMTMDSVNQVIQIGLIHDKLQAKGEVKPMDFISNAPKPGTHLTNGSTRATIPRDQMDPDDYIALRREEKRSKLRH